MSTLQRSVNVLVHPSHIELDQLDPVDQGDQVDQLDPVDQLDQVRVLLSERGKHVQPNLLHLPEQSRL